MPTLQVHRWHCDYQRSRTYSETKTAVFLRYSSGYWDIKPVKLCWLIPETLRWAVTSFYSVKIYTIVSWNHMWVTEHNFLHNCSPRLLISTLIKRRFFLTLYLLMFCMLFPFHGTHPPAPSSSIPPTLPPTFIWIKCFSILFPNLPLHKNIVQKTNLTNWSTCK